LDQKLGEPGRRGQRLRIGELFRKVLAQLALEAASLAAFEVPLELSSIPSFERTTYFPFEKPFGVEVREAHEAHAHHIV
jgi:hypothetical protein